MKGLEELDELKYTALLAVNLYFKTGNKTYRRTLQYVLEETWTSYGFKGVSEVIDYIRKKSL